MSAVAEVTVKEDAGLRPIAVLCDGEVTRQTDSGRDLVLMLGLRFLVAGSQRKADALLCVNHPNPTYPTKLYLSENMGGGLNWNESAYLLGRNWYTYSWKDVPANQPLIAILAAHLVALNPPT